MRGEPKDVRHKCHKAMLAAAALLSVTALCPPASHAEEPVVIPAPNLDGGGALMDTYLWHVRGLPPGKRLAVYSGAGPRFRVIHALEDGEPIERLSCKDISGGYWCRIATVTRPRISGWVDGRFLLEEPGFAPPDDLRNPPVEPEILIDPFGKPRRP